MALTKKIVIDKIEILEDGQIQIRQATKVYENEIELGKTYHRWVLAPGQDVTLQPIRIQNVANVVWTEPVIAAYKAKIEELNLKNA